MAALAVLFCLLDCRLGRKRWVKRVWAAAWAATAALILAATVLFRDPGETRGILRPFAAFAYVKSQPEIYREMLMNVLLYFPLGMAAAGALPERLRPWVRTGIAVGAGLLLSLLAEGMQYRYGLGLAETDDVLCNTLGVLLGGSCLPLSRWIQKKARE